MPAGRPPIEFDFKLCEEICEQVASGMAITKVLNSKKEYPSWATFRKWKNENKELLTLYTRARQDKAEPLDEKIDELLNKLETGKIKSDVARVMIDTLKWKLSKYYPKMFGDKIQEEQSLDEETKELDHKERSLRILELQKKLKNIE